MGTKPKVFNERFYDEYKYFDEILCERLKVEEDGVPAYLRKMKECYIEAKDAIPEWDVTFERLKSIRERYTNLKNDINVFKHFQGKDEDVVWMNVFKEKLDADADPLSKYSRMDFSKKKKNKGILAKLFGAFGK